MLVKYIVDNARQFLVSRGVLAGDVLAIKSFPVAPQPVPLPALLEPGAELKYTVVGFCKLPVKSLRAPALLLCRVDLDYDSEDSFLKEVDFCKDELSVPVGQLTIFEAIEACRIEASRRDIPLGREVLGLERRHDDWLVFFERTDLSTRPNNGVLFCVNDSSGKVTVVNWGL